MSDGQILTNKSVNLSHLDSNSKRFLIILFSFVVLLAIFTAFLKIPIRFNTSITQDMIFYLNLSTIFIFMIGTIYKPWSALFICTVGSLIGEWMHSIIFGAGWEMPIYLIFTLFQAGILGLIISLLRTKIKRDFFPMLIGGILQIIIVFLSTQIYYVAILDYGVELVAMLFPIGQTLFDLPLIIIAIILNTFLRKKLQITFLDELIQ